jgi:aerobic-type carbon monoxide dehydrogenase small subunit (CoxS/CutS family)
MRGWQTDVPALALVNDDAEVTTIDGSAANGALLDGDAFHCGNCTSGQI